MTLNAQRRAEQQRAAKERQYLEWQQRMQTLAEQEEALLGAGGTGRGRLRAVSKGVLVGVQLCGTDNPSAEEAEPAQLEDPESRRGEQRWPRLN
jgi:hypothetical protein